MQMISINSLMIFYLAVFTVSSAADLFIDFLNIRHLRKKGDIIPEILKKEINIDKLNNINHYTIDHSKLSIVRTIIGKLIFLGIILFGFLPFIVGYLKDLHFIPAGLIFFAILGLITTVADLPFDLLQIFRIEEKYGFNTRTFRTWVSDLLKSLIISVVIGSILLSSLLLIIQYAAQTWWIWAWLFFFAFQLLMTTLYPTVIAPLFNRFTPIKNDELAEKIRSMADQEGLRIKDIFQMDAARRSRHTNAYFSGLGKTKRIVLFDTLLESHDEEEILAILAHEIGHLKSRHIMKQMFIMGGVTFFLFFIASLMIEWQTMYETFGFSMPHSYVGIFLIAILWEPAEFFFSPLVMALSRKFEREADQYVLKVTDRAEPFIRALKNMTRDNLTNLYPHPIYIRFNYSHPPVLERIQDLEVKASKIT